jgi:basic membrane protein A
MGQSQQPSGGQGFKVALLLPGPINDHGWNQNGYEGLQAIKRQLAASVAFTENVAQSDQLNDFRGYATLGYNLIIGHGFQFGDAAKQVAPGFPREWFVVTSSTITQAPNVVGILGDTYQEGFLAGVAAAALSTTHTVGAVGGQSDPPITNALAGFEAGAKYLLPGIKVLTGFTESYSDIAKAREFAEAMIAKGADVLIGDANQASIGVIESCKVRRMLCIGINTDAHSLAPDNVPVSVVQDYGPTIVAVAKRVRDGTMALQALKVGIPEGQYRLSPWYGKVPADVRRKVDQIEAQIRSGALKIGR